MGNFIGALADLRTAMSAIGAAAPVAHSAVPPFETAGQYAPQNAIDSFVIRKLRKDSIPPADLCSDEVFIRRVYLDVIGTLPKPEAVLQFLGDSNPHRRAALIESLFKRPEFADYWSLKWCDILRVKAEFPSKLWPDAVEVYHHWIHDAIRDNMPYDQFARALLTSSGSDFRVAPVNFYRAVQERDPASIARAVALTFMGVRFGEWPKSRRDGMAAFFSRIEYKHTHEWKEEIVCLNPAPVKPFKATFPGGRSVKIEPDQDPRVVFADWLITKDNPYFTRNIVNRIWDWLMGRGIINPPDDIRPKNRPSNPELLRYLEKQLISANFDLRHIYRLILNSRTYQQSSIPHSDKPEAEALFAYYPVRRLDAEVLIDALDWIGGTGEHYVSEIPEPFTFIPQSNRTITLADGSITSPFLEMFGRPARDTGLVSERNNAPSDAQRLYLLNSSAVQRKIQQSWRIRGILRSSNGNTQKVIRSLYLTILSRNPTDKELAAATNYAKTSHLNSYQVAVDLAWALINTKEFLYRH